MWLTHRNKRCVELDDRVFQRLLTFYPEEELVNRPVLSAAIRSGEIRKSDLIAEADKLFIPWQMFLLSWPNLRRHLLAIERERRDKIDVGHISTRTRAKGAVPYRLIDRYIRAQRFLLESEAHSRNTFCGSLRGKSVPVAVAAIEQHFGISRKAFWARSTKERAFEYLAGCIESGNVNVALGTSEARLVPTTRNHKSLYKNVSGFCLKNPKVPFAFVHMNMADAEEPAGRRIYTLMLLVVLIGLDIYTVTRDWRPGRTRAGRDAEHSPTAHAIVGEFLLPSSAFTHLKGRRVTRKIIDDLSDAYKLTPTAVTYRLWKARIIDRDERDSLITPSIPIKRKARSPYIENAVRKLNGGLVVSAVNSAFSRRSISQNQAQYVLFGRIRRPLWAKYRARVGI